MVTSSMSAITFVEPASWIILIVAALSAARRGRLRTFLTEGVLVALGGLIGEWAIMRWYGFYSYNPGWTLFVDVMPVTVALIWGFVLISARELAGWLHPSRPAWLVGVLVLYDAALIEPVASAVGLWQWDDSGLWTVPWIGWIGWAFYASAASWLLDRPRWKWTVPVVAVAFTHVMLLAFWWGGMRWFAREQAPEALLVGGSIVLSLLLSWAATRVSVAPLAVILPRAPAGLLFFVLLPLASPSVAFVAYVLPFALPWFVVTARAWSASRKLAPTLEAA